MSSTRVALLIPSTSYGRDDWKTLSDTYLIKHTLRSFLYTYNMEHQYTFYIGIDRNDRIYDNDIIKAKICEFVSRLKNVGIEFIYMDNVAKGHLTVMWNILYKKALDENNEYFFQCGDDIEFHTKGWVNDCIAVLSQTNGIGLVGPINNNPSILTQSFVSRKHYDLFGYYFPPEIINWFCDDWINRVYRKLERFYPLNTHYCKNVGGQPRYNVNNDENFMGNEFSKKMAETSVFCDTIVERDYERAVSSGILSQKLKSKNDINTNA